MTWLHPTMLNQKEYPNIIPDDSNTYESSRNTGKFLPSTEMAGKGGYGKPQGTITRSGNHPLRPHKWMASLTVQWYKGSSRYDKR